MRKAESNVSRGNGRKAGVISEHIAESFDIPEFGSQSSANNVVRAGHNFETIARKIGMRFVSREEAGLARFDLKIVEKKSGNDDADVVRIFGEEFVNQIGMWERVCMLEDFVDE